MTFFRAGHFYLIWTMKPELGEKFRSEAPVGGGGGVWVGFGDGVGGLF